MTRLSSEQVLKDKKTRDTYAISALVLTHRALSDVLSLSDFKNLERLDLGFNSLTSLEGLQSCVNLKWLSVIQNKLERLKGIEGLSKLTVLNAGKNKLRLMEEVRSLASLRALILNDNEIVTICRLDQAKELNTLVLSRNPVSDIGESLVKVKSLTKLSLSNCQLQTIGSSLKSCIELKELRLAHNDIKTLPTELTNNAKLQNLDLGNNLITKWSDLKVLKSLTNLKNLNLLGNPVAENDKIAKKIRKSVSNLQIFNTKPLDRNPKNEKGDKVDRIDNTFSDAANKLQVEKEVKGDQGGGKKFKDNTTSQSKKDRSENAGHLNTEKGLKRKRQKTSDELSKKEVSSHKDDSKVEEKVKRKSKKVVQSELDVIDDGEISFMELFAAADTAENPNYRDKTQMDDKAVQDTNPNIGGVATYPTTKKKVKSRGMGPSALQLSMPVEVGMGGQSTWDKE